MYHLALSGRRLLARIPMSIEGCEALLRQHWQLLNSHHSTIQALIVKHTTDLKLQQATIEKLTPMLPS